MKAGGVNKGVQTLGAKEAGGVAAGEQVQQNWSHDNSARAAEQHLPHLRRGLSVFTKRVNSAALQGLQTALTHRQLSKLMGIYMRDCA